MNLTAVGRSIDVGLAADPASCVRTAASPAPPWPGAASRPPWSWVGTRSWTRRAFGGLSGIVYRSSSTLLEQACERTGRRSRRLAEGLTAYAQGMTEVRRRLDEAVAVAAPHLDVAGGRIWSPPCDPPAPTTPAPARGWAAWHDAVDRGGRPATWRTRSRRSGCACSTGPC